jgi:two-component system, NarL family, response regulator DesR
LIRVLVIGDSVPVATLLSNDPDIQVVGEVEFDSQIAPRAAEFGPRVVVFNTDYMVGQVLPVVAELKARIPGCSLLMLADPGKRGMLPPRRLVRELSFLVRDARAQLLTDTIHRMVDGERVIHPRLQVATLGTEKEVSTRELEVLGLAAEGEPAPVVAERLCLSERTVRNYLSTVVRKMGARNILDAIRIARQDGWLR